MRKVFWWWGGIIAGLIVMYFWVSPTGNQPGTTTQPNATGVAQVTTAQIEKALSKAQAGDLVEFYNENIGVVGGIQMDKNNQAWLQIRVPFFDDTYNDIWFPVSHWAKRVAMVHYAGTESYNLAARSLIMRYIGKPKPTTQPATASTQ